MIDIEEKYLTEILRILDKYAPDCEIRAFGSRIEGRPGKYSDLDIALVGEGKIDWRRIEALKDVLAASDLPFIIDVIDWHAISNEFRAVVEKKYVVIREKPEKPANGHQTQISTD
jgi:predicted nucleotidyltransferase